MTEKNIFVYNFFVVIHFNLQPPLTRFIPLFPAISPSSENWDLVKPSFLKIWSESQTWLEFHPYTQFLHSFQSINHLQGSTNVYVLAYALEYASKNWGLCMRTDTLLLNEIPPPIIFLSCPLGNAAFAIFANNVPTIPIRNFWKDIS